MVLDPCLNKSPTPLLPKKKLDIIFRRRHVPNTQYYFTDRKHTISKTKAADRIKTTCFQVPKPQKLLSYIRYSDQNDKFVLRARMNQPLHLKDNVKISATRNLSQRLFINNEAIGLKSIVDVHPEFYTVVEGRPIRRKDDINVYVCNIRNYAMYRQQIGYRYDTILKIDHDNHVEKKDFLTVENNLRQHINHFRAFLTEDYKFTDAESVKVKVLNQKVQDMISEYLALVIKQTNLETMLFKADFSRSVLKTYRLFLSFLAPLYWREQHDETYKSVAAHVEQGQFVTHSQEFTFDDEELFGESLAIDKILEDAKNEFKHPVQAHLYYHSPNEIMRLFHTMELQSREYLLHLSKTRGPYKLLLNGIQNLKELTKKELDFSQFYIENLEREISRERSNETFFYNKFMRILNETFFDAIASPKTLRLKLCIEYVYEQVFGKCEEGLNNLRDPMKILENTYDELNLSLDQLDFSVVKEASKDCFAHDLEIMRKAFAAQRELRQFEMMTAAVKRAFLPPAKFKRPKLTKFIDKDTLAEMKREEKRKMAIILAGREKRKKYTVSPEQRENLILFTEWCDGMNPAPFLKQIETYITPVFQLYVEKSADSMI